MRQVGILLVSIAVNYIICLGLALWLGFQLHEVIAVYGLLCLCAIHVQQQLLIEALEQAAKKAVRERS